MIGNAVGGNHIPHVDHGQCIKLGLLPLFAARVPLLRVCPRRCCYAAAVSDDPSQRGGPGADEGLLDLLGVLAYGSLTAFFRISDDAAMALALADKTALAELAVAQFGHFQLLSQRIRELGAEPGGVMQPLVGPIDAFHARTAPPDWLARPVKPYPGEGLARRA